MLDIKVDNLTKRYNFQAIIKDFSFHFEPGKNYSIKGKNGSGKSTLMHLLSGYLSPSTGSIQYSQAANLINRKDIYRYVSISSPYCTLIDDFSLSENLDYFCKFKNLQAEYSYRDILNILDWKDTKDKQYGRFSSGMRQKASVLFSFISDSPLLLLDEPTSYMDVNAKEWYRYNFIEYCQNKTVIIASNEATDFIGIDGEILLG
jgi:ABC-type multidrug transport system ATPase subunit